MREVCKNEDESAYYYTCVLELVCRVCLQVAGKQYSIWEDFLLQGRHKGREEMTLEELLKHIKVNAHAVNITHFTRIRYHTHH